MPRNGETKSVVAMTAFCRRSVRFGVAKFPRHFHRRRPDAMPLGTQTIACVAALAAFFPVRPLGDYCESLSGPDDQLGLHPLGFRPQPLETRFCRCTTRTTAKTYLYGFFDPRCPAEAQTGTRPSPTAALATRRPVSCQPRLPLIDARRPQLTPAVRFRLEALKARPGAVSGRNWDHTGTV